MIFGAVLRIKAEQSPESTTQQPLIRFKAARDLHTHKLPSLAKLMSHSEQAHTFSAQLVTLDPFVENKKFRVGQPILENL